MSVAHAVTLPFTYETCVPHVYEDKFHGVEKIGDIFTKCQLQLPQDTSTHDQIYYAPDDHVFIIEDFDDTDDATEYGRISYVMEVDEKGHAHLIFKLERSKAQLA